MNKISILNNKLGKSHTKITSANVFFSKTKCSPTKSYNDTPCIEWQYSKNRSGYGQVTYNGKGISSHRLSWILNRGSISKNKGVLHHCDNPPCVNPLHLHLGTHKQNMRERGSRGRQAKGVSISLSKLSAGDILEIRRLHATGDYLYKDIGDRFEISPAHIGKIVTKTVWKHI